jgi:hypothetical protein
MSNFYVSGSAPSAPVTHVKLFISYTLGHVTSATVKDVFDTVFDNEVTQIEELAKEDRVTGKPFKLFWITLEPARHSRVWRFVDEIEQYGSARIIYETKRGTDYYWQVRINKDKPQPVVKTNPRILPREVTTSETATDKERADVIAFTKTPEFSKLVKSVVVDGVIEPKLEPGEIKEKPRSTIKLNASERRKAERASLQKRCVSFAEHDAKSEEHLRRAKAAGMTVDKYLIMKDIEKREREALQEETDYGKRQRLEMQEEALADWERQQDAFIFDDEAAALKAM